MNAMRAQGPLERRRASWPGRWLAALALLLFAAPLHAAITFVGAATVPASGGPTTSRVVGVPGGVVAGDLMLAQIAVRGGSGVTITPPIGWTAILVGTHGTDLRQGLYYRIASAAEPGSYTFAFSSSQRSTGAIVAYRGVDGAAAIHASSTRSNASSTAVSADAVTTSTSDTLIVGLFSSATVTSFAPPAGMTERYDAASAAGPNGVAIAAAEVLQPAAGSSGSRTATAGHASVNIGALVALKPGGGLDHVRLEHSGNGLTCMPSAVTVKACADAACSVLYSAGSTTVTLSPSGWSANPVTFTGSATVSLAVTAPSTVTLGATATAPLAANASRCYVGGTATCSHSFADTGFVFSAIPTQTAGVPSGSVSVRAVKKADGSSACTGLFSGSVSIGMASQCIDPSTCAGKTVRIGATAIAANPASAIAAYTPVTLNFDASATATFTFDYADVGKLSLSARHLLGGADAMVGTSNTFVVRPWGFTVTDIRRSADGAANPAAVDATGPAFIKAGAPFTATVAAIAQGGAATPNFGRESAPEGVQLSAVLVPGLGLASNPALANGSIAGTGFVAGVAMPADLAWNETGVITLASRVADGDYLGTGDVAGTPSVNVGRFHPDHFELVAGSLANRTDIVPACAPTANFTYMDEPFQVGFRLTAKGAGNVTLVNYASSAAPAQDFAKLATAVPIPAGFGFAFLDGATDLSARVGGGLGIAGSWTGGVLDAIATLGLARLAAPDGPYDALKIGIAPVDADGVRLGVFDMDVAAPAGNDHAQVGQTRIRFGRLRMGNAYGSELLDLYLPLRLQYWDGAQFTTHTDDSCTTLAAANVALGNYQRALASGETAVMPASLVFASGAATLRLTRPGSGNGGSVDLCVDLGTDPPGGTTCVATGAGKGYLQGKWAPGTSWDNDPVARAGFGLHRGSRRLIYLREMY